MSEFVKPETRSIMLTTASPTQTPPEQSFSFLFTTPEREDVEYNEETISRGDYIKEYLLQGKYNDKVSFESFGQDTGSFKYYLDAFYFDKNGNDRAAFYGSRGYPSSSTMYPVVDAAFVLTQNLGERRGEYINSSFQQLITDNRFDRYSYQTILYFTPFDSFIHIDITVTAYTLANGYYHMYVLYDYTNKELFSYNERISDMVFVKPDNLSYSIPLTRDGGNGTATGRIIRTQSLSEIRYTKIKRMDGVDSTRVYMLTQFPENCAWKVLNTDTKKILVLPYNRASYDNAVFGSGGHEGNCAIAIDISNDYGG